MGLNGVILGGRIWEVLGDHRERSTFFLQGEYKKCKGFYLTLFT